MGVANLLKKVIPSVYSMLHLVELHSMVYWSCLTKLPI